MRFHRRFPPVAMLVATLAGAIPGFGTDSSVVAARALMTGGDLEKALASLEETGSQDPEAVFLRGVVLAELNRSAEAERVFRDLIARYPAYPEPYNNLAVLLAESGRFDEAVENLKSALRTHPSYGAAWENLTTIYGRLASEAYGRALDVDNASQTVPVELDLLESLGPPPESGMVPVARTPVAAARVPTSAEEEAPEPAGPVTSAPGIPQRAKPVEDLVSAPMPAQPEPEVEEADPSTADLAAVVQAWAAAWAGQRVDEYLSFYSSSFTPGEGMGLEQWRAVRRARLRAPAYIRVSVTVLDYDFEGEQARVVFNQSYESNTFSDLVTKTLTLVRERDGWKIVRETVGP